MDSERLVKDVEESTHLKISRRNALKVIFVLLLSTMHTLYSDLYMPDCHIAVTDLASKLAS